MISSTGGLLKKYLSPYHFKVGLLGLFLLLGIALQVINPQILRRFIDSALSNGAESVLLNAGLLFIGIVLLTQIVNGAAAYLAEDVGWLATNQLRIDLTNHCLNLDLSFHETYLPGELISRIDGDVSTLTQFFSHFIFRVLGSILLLCGILIALFLEDWRIGLAMAIYAILGYAVLFASRSFALPHLKAARQTVGEIVGFWEEHLSAREDIAAFGAQPFVIGRHHQLLRQLLRSSRRANVYFYSLYGVWSLVYALGTSVLFLLGAQLFFQQTLTLGSVYLILYYNTVLSQGLVLLTEQTNSWQTAAVGLRRIQELYATESRLANSPDHRLSPKGPLNVTFEAVTFRYNPTAAEPILKHLSFQIEPRQIVGLLGRTGSGKSTIARLLLRFSDVDHGSIQLNGTDLRQLSVDNVRDRVGLVTQTVQLFHATLRDNITLFNPSISDEKIMEIVTLLGLADWLNRQPDRLETMIASGGSNLSSGEGQLIAFVRIFLKDPGLIILDEASSRLDPETERFIETALDRLLQNRTAIIIAHRLQTIARVDRVIILEKGEIIERGERSRLVADPNSRLSQLLQTEMQVLASGGREEKPT